MQTGYLAPEGFENELESELPRPFTKYGRLYICEGEAIPSLWALSIWHHLEIIPFTSIGEAARLLRARQRNWVLYPHAAFRRSQLIADKLPHISFKPISFPSPLSSAPLGSWTLIDQNTLMAAKECSSPFANGEPNFIEDKIHPPSRAYLKLYEGLTQMGKWPKQGEKCLEIGAAPGSWTWVLQRLSAQVIACDRAELAPAIGKLPGIEFIKGDAFSLTPEKIGPLDWIVSDIICYPEKLYDWISRWLDSGLCKNYVLTLKLQGEWSREAIELFRKVKNSRILHLFHNKHELTWLCSTDEK